MNLILDYYPLWYPLVVMAAAWVVAVALAFIFVPDTRRKIIKELKK